MLSQPHQLRCLAVGLRFACLLSSSSSSCWGVAAHDALCCHLQWERATLSSALVQGPVWRVSWSVTGNILAVSDSKNSTSLWKEALDGQWQQVSA